MTKKQRNKMNFILENGKRKSWLFHASIWWHEAPPFYKLTAVIIMSTISIISLVSLNIVSGLGIMLFSFFGFWELDKIGASICDTISDALIYDMVEANMEVMTQDEIESEPTIVAQKQWLQDNNIESIVDITNEDHVVQLDNADQLEGHVQTHRQIIKDAEKQTSFLKSATSSGVMFWQGKPVDKEEYADLADEIGLSL